MIYLSFNYKKYMTKNKSGKKDNRENKPKKNKAKRMKKEAMLHSVMSVFQSSPKEPFNYKQISKLIGVESQVQKLQVVDLLYDLSAENFITKIDRGRYRLYRKMGVRRFSWRNGIPDMRWTVIK